MPTYGKCISCGENAYLSGILVTHTADKHLEFWMVCPMCKKYYEYKKEETK